MQYSSQAAIKARMKMPLTNPHVLKLPGMVMIYQPRNTSKSTKTVVPLLHSPGGEDGGAVATRFSMSLPNSRPGVEVQRLRRGAHSTRTRHATASEHADAEELITFH